MLRGEAEIQLEVCVCVCRVCICVVNRRWGEVDGWGVLKKKKKKIEKEWTGGKE